jgi:hypothetical protein
MRTILSKRVMPVAVTKDTDIIHDQCHKMDQKVTYRFAADYSF